MQYVRPKFCIQPAKVAPRVNWNTLHKYENQYICLVGTIIQFLSYQATLLPVGASIKNKNTYMPIQLHPWQMKKNIHKGKCHPKTVFNLFAKLICEFRERVLNFMRNSFF